MRVTKWIPRSTGGTWQGRYQGFWRCGENKPVGYQGVLREGVRGESGFWAMWEG